MRKGKITIVGAILVMVSMLVAACAPAAPPVETPAKVTPEEFYKGKTMEWVVPYSPGGGYDTYTRLMAEFMEDELDATIVVRNVPGAGGLVGINTVAAAEPDGLTIMIAPAVTAIMADLFEKPGAKFDAMEMTWIGRVAYEAVALGVTPGGPYKTWKDIVQGKEVKFALTGPDSTSSQNAMMLTEAFDIDIKPILGYAGSSEAAVAVARGEADVRPSSTSSVAAYVREGLLKPVALIAKERSPLLPDTPTIGELVPEPTEKQRKWLNRIIAFNSIKRVVLGPPGIPEKRVEFLRKKLMKILHDEELLATAKKIGRPIRPLPGKELRKMAAALLDIPEKEKEELRYVMMKKYYE